MTESKNYQVDLFLGTWKRSIPSKNDDFSVGFVVSVDTAEEPHLRRRNAILHDHPGMIHLYGYDRSSQLISVLCVINQLLMAHLMSKGKGTLGNLLLVACAFAIGGSLTQICGELIHECSHNLVSKTAFSNKIFGLITNLVVPFPISMSFKKHHLNHHAFQGVANWDPDLPLHIELTLIRGNTFLKVLWLILYPVMYVIRGLAITFSLNRWECVNAILIIIFDALVFYFFGLRSLIYMVISLWFGYSIHPAAAHFIQEHYTFTSGQETYSYYGCLNELFLNIGYHNEHHDFPQVAWSRLPLIYAIAPEYYQPLMSHSSWLGVIFSFLFDPLLGPQSRVVRDFEVHLKGRRRSASNLS